MISFIKKNNKLNENKNSFVVTYPRSVEIIFGNYPYPDIIHNFILNIKNNIELGENANNYSNVKGGKTDWNYFLGNKDFEKFFTYLINTNQPTYPKLFEYFLEKYKIHNAWGNEIKKGDSLKYHIHPCWHGILYLTKGCDLILPELNIKITPEPGDYYIFPPQILHGFDKYEGEINRYSLVFNMVEERGIFDLEKKLKEKDDKNNK
tara:strand:- start:628 stop:1245 length:618 start_codon:yes stop_codon:yes gene_type:complete